MAADVEQMDEGEFAGYVDSGIWMIEEFLNDLRCEGNTRQMYFDQLWRDYFRH